jgi:hypothetical protein
MAEEKQTSLKPLTIYFYHTRLTRESYEEWKEYKFPGHILWKNTGYVPSCTSAGTSQAA